MIQHFYIMRKYFKFLTCKPFHQWSSHRMHSQIGRSDSLGTWSSPPLVSAHVQWCTLCQEVLRHPHLFLILLNFKNCLLTNKWRITRKTLSNQKSCTFPLKSCKFDPTKIFHFTVLNIYIIHIHVYKITIDFICNQENEENSSNL